MNLAKQLERVITWPCTDVMNAMQKFAKDHGIQSAVEWLSANATSLDKIQAFGDSEIKKIVTKAVEKHSAKSIRPISKPCRPGRRRSSRPGMT